MIRFLRRIEMWLRGPEPVEPEPEHFAWVLAPRSPALGGRYIKVARSDPNVETVYTGPEGYVGVRPSRVIAQGANAAERDKRNRAWIIGQAPDVCLFL